MKTTDQISPNYLALYGLREAAFSQEHDDRFFFLDTEQARRLSLLHNLIQDPNLFLHIKGISGVGKTSLINRFVNINEEDWRFSFFSANAMMNSEQLFFNISAGFGLSGLDDNSDLKAICLKNVSSLEASGVVPILIIDDAHELPIETLKSIFELVNRWDKNHPKLRIILISNQQFDQTLESDEIKPLRNIISHELEVEALAEEQIERYIYFRLSVAGLDGGNPITPEACTVIMDKSRGIPEKINNLCHVALRDGMDEMTMKEFFDEHNFNFPIRKYLITASIMAIFIGAVFSFIEPGNRDGHQVYATPKNKIYASASMDLNTAITSSSVFAHLKGNKIKPEKIIKVKSNIRSKKKKIKSIRLYNFSRLKNKFTRSIVRSNSIAIYRITKLQLKKLESSRVTEKHSDKSKYNINTLTTITSKNFPEIKSVIPTTLFPDTVETRIKIYGVRLSSSSEISIHGKNGSTKIEKNKIFYVSDNQINVKFIPGNYIGNNWIVVTDPKNGKSNSKLLQVKADNYTGIKLMEDKQWILAQNSDLFILHVLGSKHKEEIIDYAQFENLSGQLAVFETKRNGVEWYHLILGTYKDRDAAKLAIQNLPQETTKPWIRPIKDIQKAIKLLNQNSL
ncbi:MAG: AAA family ATPase [Gammaproteobacteria bacterium]